MGTDIQIPLRTAGQHSEAVLRISEALAGCRTSEDLARILADELSEVLPLGHLGLVIFKENGGVERQVCGEGPFPFPDLLLEEGPTEEDESLPAVHQMVAGDLNVLSVVRAPLTTLHRRLGTLTIASNPETTYSGEDVTLLRAIARVVAFAIEDCLNRRRTEKAQLELQRQNDRLQLLLNLTNRITSNLGLRELLKAVAANIRQVMRCDAVCISLCEPESGKNRLYALDFPRGKGLAKEMMLVTPVGAAKKALETLTPVIVNTANPEDFPPEIYELLVAEDLKHQCLIPLANHGRALGLLAVGRTGEGNVTSDDIDFLSQASGQIAVAIENALAYLEISALKEKLAQEKLYLEEEIRTEMGFEQIIGNSASLRRVLEMVETVAPSDSTVLLLGETGTGKELVARAIHDRSRRKDRTFVKLNCAAIPTGLLESELFGHEKGAFTGAISSKTGRLELADQGTLFLDEIGDVTLEIQPKLLRALQEREFERLGSTQTRKANVRLVAATNRDLEQMVAERQFRSDLYYRLHVFPIRIPPLRERKEDIPLLVSYFVQKFSEQMQKKIESIPVTVMKALTSWDWPGNIRELENFIERGVLLTRGKSLEAPLAELQKRTMDEPARSTALPGRDDLTRIVKETIDALDSKKLAAAEHANRQRDEIVRALGASKGRVGGADGAAARLGLNRTTLLSRMKKFGVEPKRYA